MINFDDLANRYTAVGGQPLDYDAAGNLTGDHDGYRYVYDYENRITRIFKLSGQTEIDVARYAYDALGRRIEARSFADGQLDAVRRYWYNDQWQVLTQGLWSQAYASLTLSRNYIYGNTIDEVLGFEWVVNGTPGMRYYYLHDHLYSPAVMLTEYGVVERYEYNAYGRRSVMTPGFAHRSNSHYLSNLGLTGREIDELDLDAAATPRLQHMHYRHRDYSPTLGRFMQHDPLGVNPNNSYSSYSQNVYYPPVQYTDGVNIYEYAKSSPQQNKDPYGLVTVKECYEIWNDRMDRIRRNLGSCTVDCLGITGETEAKCAIGCAVFKSLGWWQFKTCMATCTGGNTLIGLWCESWCFKGFKNESDSANEALEKCIEKACGKIV